MRYASLDICRSLLFVPGNRARMLDRAATSGADVIVVDLEDAVPATEKAEARRLTRAALPKLTSSPVFVRVNSVASGLCRADLMAVVRPGVAGVVLPKTEREQDLRDLDVLLREAELRNKVRPGDTAVVPLIESPRAILDIQRIVTAIDRVAGLALGGEDYTAALGVARSDEALAFARGMLVTAASSHGIAAIDTPYPAIDDESGLAGEARRAAALGFRGKFVIHPAHVAPVNAAFSPTAEEVARARKIVLAAAKARRAGKGSVALAGQMVDAPIVSRAERVLAAAQRMGKG